MSVGGGPISSRPSAGRAREQCTLCNTHILHNPLQRVANDVDVLWLRQPPLCAPRTERSRHVYTWHNVSEPPAAPRHCSPCNCASAVADLCVVHERHGLVKQHRRCRVVGSGVQRPATERHRLVAELAVREVASSHALGSCSISDGTEAARTGQLSARRHVRTLAPSLAHVHCRATVLCSPLPLQRTTAISMRKSSLRCVTKKSNMLLRAYLRMWWCRSVWSKGGRVTRFIAATPQ